MPWSSRMGSDIGLKSPTHKTFNHREASNSWCQKQQHKSLRFMMACSGSRRSYTGGVSALLVVGCTYKQNTDTIYTTRKIKNKPPQVTAKTISKTEEKELMIFTTSHSLTQPPPKQNVHSVPMIKYQKTLKNSQTKVYSILQY